MTTETILTNEEIIMIGHQASAIEAGENGHILPIAFARAIEQAILQSTELQRLKNIEMRAKKVASRRDEDGYLVLTVDIDALKDAMEQEND